VSEIPAELAARIPDAAGQTLTVERVRERQRLRDLGPDREYVRRKFARYRKPVQDAQGKRVKDPRTGEDKMDYSIPLREPDGKPTRASVEMMATFGPQMRAEVEARNNREQFWHGRVNVTGIVRRNLDASQFCPRCEYRKAWCECHDQDHD
jgi:hypothetical protein